MATESDNVNSGALGTLVAVGTIAFFGIALVVTALVRAEMAEEVGKKEVSADRPYRDLVAEQSAKLASPASYVDRAKGVVSLPIERAMELTVAGLKQDPNSATAPGAAAAGGTGGAGSTSAASGSGGMAGGGGMAGAGGGGGARPLDEAVHAQPKSAQEKSPVEQDKNEKANHDTNQEKKKAPKPAAPVPAAPAPAAPAPAPAPAPNGQ